MGNVEPGEHFDSGGGDGANDTAKALGDPCLGLPTAGKNVKAGTIAERRSVVPFPTAGKNAKAGKIVGKM